MNNGELVNDIVRLAAQNKDMQTNQSAIEYLNSKWPATAIVDTINKLASQGMLNTGVYGIDDDKTGFFGNIGTLTAKGRARYSYEIPEISNSTSGNQINITGGNNNIQQGNNNLMVIRISNNDDYSKLKPIINAIAAQLKDYQQETQDKRFEEEFYKLKKATENKENPSKLKQILRKLKGILESQAVTNTISFISALLNMIQLINN